MASPAADASRPALSSIGPALARLRDLDDPIIRFQLALHFGSAAMQPAIDQLMEAQLPDGTWPLRQTFRPPELPTPERRHRSKSSPMITLRVIPALSACTEPAA